MRHDQEDIERLTAEVAELRQKSNEISRARESRKEELDVV